MIFQLTAFVAALRIFLAYGLNNSNMLSCRGDKDPGPSNNKITSKETFKKDIGAYRPPHLRRKTYSLQQKLTRTSQTLSDHDSSHELSSSDSDFSDSDGVLKDFDNVRSNKARVSAINCIQVKS